MSHFRVLTNKASSIRVLSPARLLVGSSRSRVHTSAGTGAIASDLGSGACNSNSGRCDAIPTRGTLAFISPTAIISTSLLVEAGACMSQRHCYQQQLQQQQQQIRCMVTKKIFSKKRPSQGNKSKIDYNKTNQQQPMINEMLIKNLLHGQNSSKTADTLQVRLLIDQARLSKNTQIDSIHVPSHGVTPEEDTVEELESSDHGSNNNNKSNVQLVSLSQAITIATEYSVDLVGISINQDVPVLRAIDYSKFIYNQKAKLGKNNKQKNKIVKSKKEYTFRAGIDANDLERKVKNMISYLQKGYSCQVVITSRYRMLKDDADIIQTTLDRIQSYIGDVGNPQGPMKKTPFGNRGSVLFQPKSKK